MIDVRMFTVGPVQENCFIVRPQGSDRAVIVDPGDEPERLLGAIESLGVGIDAILLTHTHFDHVGAVAPVARATGAPVYCPELETVVLSNIMDYVPWPGFGPFESYDADHTLSGGERLELAGMDIDVIFTPGHSPGHVTYAIPAGASVHKFGGLGYVGFAEEVRAQEKALGFAFDYIVVCTVTGSTHAGMLVGFAKDGRARKVIGIDASFTPAQTKAQVLSIAQNTARLVELGQEIVEDDVVLLEDYAHPAYGVPSEDTKQAIRLSARLEGMITDPVYEGKSMQGMIDLVNKGYFPAGSKVLYAHLGGAPALNGYGYTFRNG